MTVTRDDWRRLYEICDHRDRLHNEDLDLFVERPDSVARGIAQDLLERFDPQGKWLVCGSVGAGKSSELLRLYQLLKDDFLVVGVDLQGATGGNIDQISPAEVLLCIGAAAVLTAKRRVDHQVDAKLVADLDAAFKGLLQPGRELDVFEFVESVALFGAEVFAPGVGAAASAAVRAAKAATGSPRVLLGRGIGGLTRTVTDGDPALGRLIAAVDAVVADVGTHVRAPLVLIDGLDKITELPTIHRLFATSRALAGPEAPLIYSGPITLMIGTEWNAAENYFIRKRLSNMVVAPPQSGAQETDELVAAGRAGMHEIVLRRCRKAGLELDTCFSPDSVELLISKSGGLVRQLIQLMRSAAREAARGQVSRVELDLANAVCDILRKDFEITMTQVRREELEYIAEHGEARGGEVSHQLLRWNYAFPYTNGHAWFAPNPIINVARRSS